MKETIQKWTCDICGCEVIRAALPTEWVVITPDCGKPESQSHLCFECFEAIARKYCMAYGKKMVNQA